MCFYSMQLSVRTNHGQDSSDIVNWQCGNGMHAARPDVTATAGLDTVTSVRDAAAGGLVQLERPRRFHQRAALLYRASFS